MNHTELKKKKTEDINIMEDLKDLFVPYEIAKKLKEVGYNQQCLAVFQTQESNRLIIQSFSKLELNSATHLLSAPTYEQVKLWFIEKYLIFITVNCPKWLHEFQGEVETSDALVNTEIFHNYNEAFQSAINAAIPFINNDNN